MTRRVRRTHNPAFKAKVALAANKGEAGHLSLQDDRMSFCVEDKFRRLLLRFERLSRLHYAFKTLAYAMINLRYYCRALAAG
jgi:hypothetical protein